MNWWSSRTSRASVWTLDTCGLSQDTWPYPEKPCLRNPPAHPFWHLHHSPLNVTLQSRRSVPTVTSCLIASVTVPWLLVNRVFRNLGTGSSTSPLNLPMVQRRKETEHPRRRGDDSKTLLPPPHLLPVPACSCKRTANVLALWSTYQAFWVGPPEPCWQLWKETEFQPKRAQLSVEQRVSKRCPATSLPATQCSNPLNSFLLHCFFFLLLPMVFFSLLLSPIQLYII